MVIIGSPAATSGGFCAASHPHPPIVTANAAVLIAHFKPETSERPGLRFCFSITSLLLWCGLSEMVVLHVKTMRTYTNYSNHTHRRFLFPLAGVLLYCTDVCLIPAPAY